MYIYAHVLTNILSSYRLARIPDFKDTFYPFFESDTLFLECVFVLFLVTDRFFQSIDHR